MIQYTAPYHWYWIFKLFTKLALNTKLETTAGEITEQTVIHSYLALSYIFFCCICQRNSIFVRLCVVPSLISLEHATVAQHNNIFYGIAMYPVEQSVRASLCRFHYKFSIELQSLLHKNYFSFFFRRWMDFCSLWTLKVKLNTCPKTSWTS